MNKRFIGSFKSYYHDIVLLILSIFGWKKSRIDSLRAYFAVDVISDEVTLDSASDNYNKLKDASTINNDDYASADNKDESDGLSDIDDVEVCY